MAGPYAFPRRLPTGEWPLADVLRIIEEHAGMTLRDYFAAKVFDRALSLTESTDGNYDIEGAAMCAYEMADAMLKARAA